MIIKDEFGKPHTLQKLFKTYTVKLSYSCMTNLNITITAHNQRILLSDTAEDNPKMCNCQKQNECPLDGKK